MYFLQALFSLLFWGFIIYIIVRLFSGKHRKMFAWLQKQLPLWEEKQLISQQQGNAILSFYNLKRAAGQKMDMVKVLSIIGSIFVGIGVLFFVASNWQRIPANLKTLLLLAITMSTLYAGYFFQYERQGFQNLGKALLLLASFFWGATVALIAQIYNIPVQDNWFIFLVWALPLLPLSILLSNEYIFLLSSVLLLIWNFFYSINMYTANYYYPLMVFLILLPAAKKLLISRRINILGLLIAASYCCFNKYEWLVLLITCGLLVWYLIEPQEKPFLYGATLCSIFWAITFFIIRQTQPNVYYLFLISPLFYFTYKQEIMENLVLCILAILVWSNLMVNSFAATLNQQLTFISSIIFQGMAGAVIYAIGIISRHKKYLFFDIYKASGYILLFICLYLLSFRDLLSAPGGALYTASFFASLGLGVIAYLMLAQSAREGILAEKAGRIEFFALLAAITAILFLLSMSGLIAIKTLITNVMLVVCALATISVGFERKRPTVFTSGVVIFALFIITRYIDMGWKLREKSLFFIIGGILIICLGAFLEKQRRKIIERMKS